MREDFIKKAKLELKVQKNLTDTSSKKGLFELTQDFLLNLSQKNVETDRTQLRFE